MKKKITLLLLSILPFALFSQRTISCNHSHLEHTPQQAASLRIEQMAGVPDTAKLIRIPVVFNVVHLGEKVGEGTNVAEDVLRKTIDDLNVFYRSKYDPYAPRSDFFYNGTKGLDTKVEFYLADLDSTCNYTNGIRRINGTSLPRYKDIGITYANTSDGFNNDAIVKNASGTHTKRYLNIWVVNKIYSNSSVIGYAHYPSGYEYAGNSFGIVAIYDNIGGVLVHEVGHILGLTHEDMAVDGISGLHGFQIIRQSANYYKSKLLGSPLVCTPTVLNEVGLLETKEFSRARCKGNFSPKVKIKNYGKSALTSCKLKILHNTQVLTDYTWNGSLNSLDTTWVTLPELSLNEGTYQFKIFSYSANGQTDANRANDTLKVATQIVGFLSSIPYSSNFESGNVSPMLLSNGGRSASRLLASVGLNSSIGLLFEGEDKESVNGTPPPGSYDPFFPYDESNHKFFAYGDVCINSGANKHYKIKYKRYQDSWGSSFFRVLANGVQTNSYSSGRERVWKTDSLIASSYNSGSVLLSFHSSCDYAYATEDRYGYGSYIVIDDLTISEVPASPFVMNFIPTNGNKGCQPLSVGLINKSTGAPMPIAYQMNLIKDGAVLDTVNEFNTTSYYGRITQAGVYSLKITASFLNGTKTSYTIPAFANSTNTPVSTLVTETFENGSEWKMGNNSSYTNLDWRTFDQGAYGKSAKSIMINQVGQTSGFTTLAVSLENGPYDFTNAKNGVALRFDRAYAASYAFFRKDEYLSIKYSTNCGQTWKEFYRKDGDQLETIPVSSNAPFTLIAPKSSEWATDWVAIDTLAGLKDVLIRFEFHPDFGNSFYLDNISLGDKQALDIPFTKIESRETITVYPNPATSQIRLDSKISISEVKIYDTYGSLMMVTEQMPINIEQLSAGVYSAIMKGKNGETGSFKFIKINP